jgi:hypothetical protein
MGKLDSKLDRILRSAASVQNDEPAQPPFGFETRVVALSRITKANGSGELARFVRRVAILAIIVTLVTSVGTYRQVTEDEEVGESLSNEYAIADSAIETEVLQ